MKGTHRGGGSDLRTHPLDAGKTGAAQPTAVSDLAIKQVDVLLNQLALVAQHCETYSRYIRERMARTASSSGSDQHESVQDDEQDDEQQAATGPADTVSAAELLEVQAVMDLHRCAAELAGHYIGLEEAYLFYGVSTACAIEQPSGDGMSTTLPSDAFYVIRKSISRALATGYADSVCAVINLSVQAAEDRVRALLQRRAERPDDRAMVPFITTLNVSGFP
jgi:hypothetical protein